MEDDAGTVFADFLTTELKTERERRQVLDQRGITVVTSSSTLGTLLSGLAAFVALKGGSTRPSFVTVVAFSLTLTLFVAAAFFGLLTTRSRGFEVVKESSLHILEEEEVWSLSSQAARLLLFGFNIKTLESLRAGNDVKSMLVNNALVAQLLALLFLTFTIIISLVDVLYLH